MNHEVAVTTRAAERYILSELESDEREAFEEHYFECQDCAEDVRALSIFVENAKAVLATPPEPFPVRLADVRPAPAPASGLWLGWLRPQLAMAGLATFFVVLLGVQFTAMQRLRAPRLSEAAVLHGISRGEVPVLRQGQPLSLLIAVEEPLQGNNITAEVRGADGAVRQRVEGTASASDRGLSLYIPDPDLPSGRYSVVIGNTQYPFEVR